MTERDKVKDRFDEFCHLTYNCYYPSDIFDWLYDEMIGEWVKVDENDPTTFPDECVGVLVLIPEEDHHVTTGMWDISKKWVLLDDYREPTSQVTHWRKMVAVPNDVEFKETHIEDFEGVVTKLRNQLQVYLDKEVEDKAEFEEFNRKFDKQTIEETDAYLRDSGIDPEKLVSQGRVFIENVKENIQLKHELADVRLELKKANEIIARYADQNQNQ
jgi:hypothetical protein